MRSQGGQQADNVLDLTNNNQMNRNFKSDTLRLVTADYDTSKLYLKLSPKHSGVLVIYYYNYINLILYWTMILTLSIHVLHVRL